MGTMLWIRDPVGFARVVEQLVMPRIAWNVLLLQDRKVDPDVFNELHFPPGQPYEVMIVGVDQSSIIRPGTTRLRPAELFPSWSYGLNASLLESYLAEQHSMVSIIGIPPFLPPFIEFYLWLGELQAEHPETKIHLHGATSFRQLFGLGYASVDYDPLVAASINQVTLPCGYQPKSREQWAAWGKWFRLIGYDWRKLETKAELVDFNITSAHWAAEHFRSEIPFRINGRRPDEEIRKLREEVPQAGGFVNDYKRRHAEEGDKVICDACSLAPHCKLYREGAVCTLPESPSRELAKCFKSRDSEKIMEGLAKIMAVEEERFDEARELEKEREDGLDPEVTKMLTVMFDQGVKLAKLRNPALLGNRTQVNVGVALSAGNATPAQLASAAIAQLEAAGWSRESITMDMIQKQLRGEEVSLAIEAESYEVDDDHD